MSGTDLLHGLEIVGALFVALCGLVLWMCCVAAGQYDADIERARAEAEE